MLKQPQFNWEAAGKYMEWKAFILMVRNVLSTYNAQEQDKIAIVKNWLGRKGLNYTESLTEGEKQACDTLQGLFDTLATKFRPQFNETIKSLQFRKLCRFEGKSAEEWMGRWCVAAAECSYREIDQQLKEQFIHGLNDKIMLDGVIRELRTKNNNEQTGSEDVLAWAKRTEVQLAKAAILNDITESHKFDKIKMAQKSKSSWDREMTHTTSHRWPCRYCGGIHMHRQCPAYGKMCTRCGKMGHFRKVCRSKRDQVVHEVEIETVQEPQEEEIETVSINSVYLNKNQSLITVHLETQVGKTTVDIPYQNQYGQ